MKKSGQQGQAMIEMVCGIIGMITLFSTLILFTAVGTERVSNLVAVRSKTAQSITNTDDETGTPGGKSILRWNSGDDQMAMTEDDGYVTSSDDATVFTEELTMDSVNFSGKSYVENNEFSDLPTTDIFWELAKLREYSEEGDDVVTSEDYISSMNKVFKILVTDADFDVTESNYMYDAISNE